MKVMGYVFLLCMPLVFVMCNSDGTISGLCGEKGSDVKWSFDTEDGVLVISGNGMMKSYADLGTPWCLFRDSIDSVQIDEGVTSIGDLAFGGCSGLTGIAIPGSVTGIGDWAFFDCPNLKSVKVEWSAPLPVSCTVFSYDDNDYMKKLLSGCTLYVPKGTLPEYESADVWKYFGKIEEY